MLRVMKAHPLQQTLAELHHLLVKQTESLEADSFGGLNQDEWHDFDKRQERIRKLIDDLICRMRGPALHRAA